MNSTGMESTAMGSTEIGEGSGVPDGDEEEFMFWSYSSQSKDGASKEKVKQKRNALWTCECFGQPERKRKEKAIVPFDSPLHEIVGSGIRKSKKCQCPVHVFASVNNLGQWVIRRAEMVHENPHPTPSKSRTIACFRKGFIKENPHVVTQMKVCSKSGMSVAQTYNLMATQRNGKALMPFSQKDVNDVVAKERKARMKGGDANTIAEGFDGDALPLRYPFKPPPPAHRTTSYRYRSCSEHHKRPQTKEQTMNKPSNSCPPTAAGPYVDSAYPKQPPPKKPASPEKAAAPKKSGGPWKSAAPRKSKKAAAVEQQIVQPHPQQQEYTQSVGGIRMMVVPLRTIPDRCMLVINNNNMLVIRLNHNILGKDMLGLGLLGTDLLGTDM
ncbi:hypothetical protein SOVF_187380 [Spinacia oleracea]|nr:hypothetical protein SOVF_187380 [Spinacia oleracea]